ncbi:MAG: MarR family transcriptional regulator [Acetobacteraceae bacterium]
MDEPASGQARAAYLAVLQVGRILQARAEPVFASAGLTATQFGVLETLLHGGPLGQRALTAKVHTSAGNMTDVIDKLEARGLLHRARQRADRRAVLVELTPAGRSLIEAVFPRHEAAVADALAALDDQDLRLLIALPAKLGDGA